MARAVPLIALALAALLPALAAAANDTECRCWPAADPRVSLTPGHVCGAQGSYAPGSAYEATLRRLAATIPAQVNASPSNSSFGNSAGDSPDRVVASAVCYWRPDAASPDCGACVALAFREAQRLCPYHRMAEAVVDGGACKAYFHDYDIMEQYQHDGPITASFHPAPGRSWTSWLDNVLHFQPDALLVLIFEAAGLGCVVFLLIQEWRARNRGPASNDYSPVAGPDSV